MSDADSDKLLLSDLVVLGKIVDAYGLRGTVKVHPFADDPEAWGKVGYWWVGREGDAPETWQRVHVVRCQARSGLLTATFEGTDDRTASESLKGMLVGVPRAALPVPAEGEYYWGDLLGLDVTNVHGDSLGRVVGLIETAANDVLRVADSEGKERLLPFVEAVVKEVSVPERRIRVDWELDW